MPTSEAPSVGELPTRVRERVVALAADVLPEVPALPGPLTRVAAFAPARRARLGATAIAAALGDDEFRAAVGTQVAARPGSPDVGAAEVAARAWLVRDERWEEQLAAASATLAPHDDAAAAARAEADRLRGQAAALRAELRDQRAAHRAELDEARAEHQTLRRRLGEARREARDAVARVEAVEAAAEEAQERARRREEQAEADSRRARAEVEEARAGLVAERRDVRTGREEASVRARYLLDTLVDAAAGLRRELALPPASTSPGAALERELAEAAETTEASASAGARRPGPSLDQLLAMPRARLLVDGYNVSMETWPTATLEAQRSRLVSALGPLVARTGAETTVVFDAAAAAAVRSPLPAPRGVRVVFSPRGVIADDVLRGLVAEEPVGRVVVVVTSDAALGRDLTAAGARVVPSSALARHLAR